MKKSILLEKLEHFHVYYVIRKSLSKILNACVNSVILHYFQKKAEYWENGMEYADLMPFLNSSKKNGMDSKKMWIEEVLFA